MNWILQDKTYGFGNFINLTPVIKWLYEEEGKRVPVFFETDFVREAYEGHFMIEVLEQRPDTPCCATSRIKCVANNEPDYSFIFRHYTGLEYTPKYKPFVNCNSESIPNLAIIVIGSGSDNPDYVDSKMIDFDTVRLIVEYLKIEGYDVWFTGTDSDYKRFEALSVRRALNNIGHSLSLIHSADIVIGNDTGLIHAAGAMDKKMFVMWKNTPFPRCKNSGVNTTYSFGDWCNWCSDFRKWI